MGIHREVIAPSLIPKAGGDKVKTDRRDAGRLVRLFRAGELTAIRVPTPTEEAVRDLCRARADGVDDVRRAKQRLGKFLLRHGQVYEGRCAWTVAHRQWLCGVRSRLPARSGRRELTGPRAPSPATSTGSNTTPPRRSGVSAGQPHDHGPRVLMVFGSRD